LRLLILLAAMAVCACVAMADEAPGEAPYGPSLLSERSIATSYESHAIPRMATGAKSTADQGVMRATAPVLFPASVCLIFAFIFVERRRALRRMRVARRSSHRVEMRMMSRC
jgi:hypothetical protein